MMGSLLPSEADLRLAEQSVYEHAIATPAVEVVVGETQALLKLECLQPTGSFKIRGATAALAAAPDQAGPMVTISAGNMARAAAYLASRVGREFIAFVPDHAPAAKLDPIRRLGGEVRSLPFAEWWALARSMEPPLADCLFIHPFADRHVMAGNGTIGIELAALGEFDVVVVPWGGGGLALGIAHALRSLRPEVEVYAVEVTTAAPLSASLAAGEPMTIDYVASFVDGIGSPEIIPAIWPLCSGLIAGVVTVTPEQAEDGVRFGAENAHVVVEGAAACAIAAVGDPRFAGKRVIAVVSGGNIDVAKAGQMLARV